MSTYMSIEQAAQRCRVSTKTVRRWIKAGRLAAGRDGHVYRIADDALGPFVGRPAGHDVDDGQDVQEDRDMSNGPVLDSGHRVLLELIQELKADAVAKAEAAAMWQARAEMLAGQLADLQTHVHALEAPKAIEAGLESPTPSEPVPEPAARPWWQRWFGP